MTAITVAALTVAVCFFVLLIVEIRAFRQLDACFARMTRLAERALYESHEWQFVAMSAVDVHQRANLLRLWEQLNPPPREEPHESQP